MSDTSSISSPFTALLQAGIKSTATRSASLRSDRSATLSSSTEPHRSENILGETGDLFSPCSTMSELKAMAPEFHRSLVEGIVMAVNHDEKMREQRRKRNAKS